MATKAELFKQLLSEYEHVVHKLMHYQSNAYHLLDRVDELEKEWAALEESERTPSVYVPEQELSERVDEAKPRRRKEE